MATGINLALILPGETYKVSLYVAAMTMSHKESFGLPHLARYTPFLFTCMGRTSCTVYFGHSSFVNSLPLVY